MDIMNEISNFIIYINENMEQIISLSIEHVQLTLFSISLAILIGVPLGIIISYVKKMNKPVLLFANVVQAIPSMALLGFAIPLLGIGTLPAITVVILYSLLPIIKNTFTGIENINPEMLEAAKGIGLTRFQVLKRIQIPLALPIIMAGVRISSVTAVGLMTMAAFIGAGGLGYLVFSGIRTLNNYQILAGAIPACFLALSVDYIGSIIEKLVTPISLQQSATKNKTKIIKQRKRQKFILGATTVLVIVSMIFVNINKQSIGQKFISVGGKDYSEQMILTHLVSDMIEDRTDIDVVRRENLGGTQVCFSALRAKEIDMYVEYSGTAYGDTLRYPPISDVKKVYDTVKVDFKEQFEIEVLEQMSFNNTYALAVRKETAEKYNLKTISDLAKVANEITIGATLEFLNREDGILGMTKKYNMKFKNEVGLDGSSRYIALSSKEVDVIDAFATDGLIKKYDLVLLEDDQSFFPPYYAMPIINKEVLDKYPEIKSILEILGKELTNETMTALNYEVDELQIEPNIVAKKFLIDRKLIKE